MGLDMFGRRRVAADREHAAATVAELTGCRLANAALAGSALVLAALAINWVRPVGWLMLAFGLSLAPVALSLEWAFGGLERMEPVSYTHLRAHETRHDLVCRLLLEKKKKTKQTRNGLDNKAS